MLEEVQSRGKLGTCVMSTVWAYREKGKIGVSGHNGKFGGVKRKWRRQDGRGQIV